MQGVQEVASQLFWFLATLQVALSIGFAVIVGRVPTPQLVDSDFHLARSQRKDNLLACGTIWLTLLGDQLPLKQGLLVGGAVLLGWLAARTLHRVRLLRRER